MTAGKRCPLRTKAQPALRRPCCGLPSLRTGLIPPMWLRVAIRSARAPPQTRPAPMRVA